MSRALDKWAVLDAIGWDPHVGQLRIAESQARHRVVSAGRRFGKSDLGGHELVPEALFAYSIRNELRRDLKRREFWIVGPNYCMDPATEVLSRRGWLSCDELSVNDVVLGQNPETGLAEWTPVEKVSVFEAAPRDMVRSSFRGHSSLSTTHHRWLVEWTRGGNEHRGWRWSTSSELHKSNDKVYACAPVANLPERAVYSDAFVELVAWYWTEGCVRPSGYVTIAQNPGKWLDRIAGLCQSLWGDPADSLRYGRKAREGWRRDSKGVCISSASSRQLLEVCRGPEKLVTYEFLCALTQHQLGVFIDAGLWGDASVRWDRTRGVDLKQVSEGRIDRMQMACQLAGLHTSKVRRGDDFWLSVYAKGSNRRWSAATFAQNARVVGWYGRVWCPTTGTGTWLARRDGQVFFTGNTDSEKEFRVLFNELSKLEVPFDRPGTYNDPQGGNMHISLWDGAFQVHAKSAAHPDSLVGEGLHGVIMAEAAKMKPGIWVKYVRPTLADFGGWSLHTSTPEGKNHFYDKWRMGQDPRFEDWSSWRMPSWINPHVYRSPTRNADVDRMLQLIADGGAEGCSLVETRDRHGLSVDAEVLDLMGDMTSEAFKQEIGADFTEFVGRVFKEFDEEVHVANLEFNPRWETYAGVDYGFTNPNVWLLLQVGPWGEVHVLDELYQPGLTADEFADEILDRGLAPSGLRAFFPDPASPGDTAILERKLRVQARGGTGGELKWRLDAIREALKEAPLHVPRGHPDRRPQLMIDRRCVETIREFNEYRYPDKKEQSSVPSQELPMKKDDHAPEALGRFFKGFFGAPQQSAKTTRARKAKVRR